MDYALLIHFNRSKSVCLPILTSSTIFVDATKEAMRLLVAFMHDAVATEI